MGVGWLVGNCFRQELIELGVRSACGCVGLGLKPHRKVKPGAEQIWISSVADGVSIVHDAR